MKKLILILLLLIDFPSFTQEYFSKRFYFDDPSMPEGAVNAIETANGYVITGNTNWWNEMSMAQTKLDGQVIWKKNWGDTISEWWNSSNTSFSKYFNAYYSVGSKNTWHNNLRHTETLLVKYNNDFDTLWTATYGKGIAPFDSSYIARSFCGTESNFGITGILAIYNFETKYVKKEESNYAHTLSKFCFNNIRDYYTHEIFFLTMDSLGNTLWEKNYPDSTRRGQGLSIIQTTDGGYAIGAYKWVIGSFGASVGDPIVIKTDSMGNKEWEVNLGGPFQDGTALVCRASDGNIMVASRYDVDSINYNQYYSRVQLTKIDNLGNILWNKLYTDSTRYTGVTNIRPDNSGGYIICGSVGENDWPYEPAYMGYMLHIDSVGDSLWYRKYAIATATDSHNYFYDAIPTSDGGFLGAGYCLPLPPDTGNQDAWIIKVDSMGCVSPSECWVSQREYELQESVNGKLVRVFPNPAKSWIEVELTEEGSHNNDFEIEITDLLGRKVESTKIPKQTGRIHHKFNTNDWNRGVYLVKLKKDGIPIGIRKVILN